MALFWSVPFAKPTAAKSRWYVGKIDRIDKGLPSGNCIPPADFLWWEYSAHAHGYVR